MKTLHLFYLLVIHLFTCKGQTSNNHTIKVESDTKIEILESFTDSLKIGHPMKTKIEIYKTLENDTICRATINLYRKQNMIWKLISSFEYDQSVYQYVDAQIIDFNNDGFGDFIYRTGTGARGGNSIMNLFVYNPKNKNMVYIKNSNEFPNLSYNPETQSICSFILTGCNETVFLELEKDSLKRRAAINECNDITVYEYDKTGKERIIFYDSTNEYGPFANFINYKPIKVKKN